MASQGRFSDTNALQFGPTPVDTAGRATHVAKHKKRNKGLHIVFDPAARQKYVGGFRQRKLDRKENAKRVAEAKAKKQRLEDRAARRAKQREELDLERYESGHEEDGAEAADAAAAQVSEPKPGPRDEQAASIGPTTVQQFFGSGVTTTVSTAPIMLHSSSEDGDSDGEESDKSQGEAPSEPRQQGSRAQKQLPIPGKLVTSKAKLAARKSRRPVRSDHKGQKRRKPQKPEQKSGKKKPRQ